MATDGEFTIRMTSCDITRWPDDLEDHPDAGDWTVILEYRGKGLWAVLRRAGGETCMNHDGEWVQEWVPSDRTPAWLADHRFQYEEAVKAAVDYLKDMVSHGETAEQAITRTRAELAARS